MEESLDTNTSQDLLSSVPRFDFDGRAYSPAKDSFNSTADRSNVPVAPEGSYIAVDALNSHSMPADGDLKERSFSNYQLEKDSSLLPLVLPIAAAVVLPRPAQTEPLRSGRTAGDRPPLPIHL